MKHIIKPALIIAALFLVSLPFWIGPYCFYLAPECKSKPVKSPNGQYEAWTGWRGWMDSINSHLYVRRINSTKPKEIQIYSLRGELSWSPDSRKVIVAGWSNEYSSDTCTFFVYDAPTGRFSDGPAIDNKPPDINPLTWIPVWLKPDTVALLPDSWSPDEHRNCLRAEVKVEDNGKTIKIVDLCSGPKR